MIVQVGDRFRVRSESPWHFDDLEGVHVYEFVARVTSVDDHVASYERVEILSEEGRPPAPFDYLARNCPHAGGFAIWAVDDLVASGKMERLP